MFGTMKKLFAVSAAVAVGGAMIAAGTLDQQAQKAEVGKPAPDFTLTDYQGKEHTLSSYTAQGNIVVLEWFGWDCPFVKKHYREDTQTFNNMISSWQGKNVVWLRINSADQKNPYGDVEKNLKAIKDYKITGPVLVDADGKVGKMYGAKRTPEMYVITADGILAYHGAIDNDSSARGPGNINYVKLAVEEILAGKPVTTPTTNAYGCSIKYVN